MDAMTLLAAALALAAAAPAHADPVSRWRPIITEASARFGLPLSWIEEVMRAESGGMTMVDGRPITSTKGAMGLMQLMPGTWADMRHRLGLGSNPHDPRDNILAGTAYLRLMYDRFGYPGMFAAYNAGPGRYAEHLRTGRALPGETIGYLAGVAPDRADRYARPIPAADPSGTGVFFALSDQRERLAAPQSRSADRRFALPSAASNPPR